VAESFDVLVVGAGPTGLACGIELQQKGLSTVLLEKGCVVNSLYHYPTHMTFFTTPELLEIGNIPMTSLNEKPNRTEALKYYRRVADHFHLDVRQYERVERIEGEDGAFRTFTVDQFDKLRFLQRELSRKQKGSNNRLKAWKLVAKLHKKVQNIRINRNHQISRKYVDQYDVIVVEDLDIMGMVSRQQKVKKLSQKARRTLRRNILDAGWGDFVQKLGYKATQAGKLLLKICPRNTTQRCSSCGSIVYKDITKRTHKCPYCGLEIDRDDNAAINIRNEGIKLIRAGNRPEPDGGACLCPDSHPGKRAPMKQEATAFRPS
jgi:IS605 OrfB family transposase